MCARHGRDNNICDQFDTKWVSRCTIYVLVCVCVTALAFVIYHTQLYILYNKIYGNNNNKMIGLCVCVYMYVLKPLLFDIVNCCQ